MSTYFQPSRKELRPDRPRDGLPPFYEEKNESYDFKNYRKVLTLLNPEPRNTVSDINNQHHSSPKQSPFLSLPTELRLNIFSYLLKSSEPIFIKFYLTEEYGNLFYSNFVNKSVRRLTESCGLLHVCRKVSDEAARVLYSNTFAIKLGENCARIWLSDIGESNRNLIRRLRLQTWPGPGTPLVYSLRQEFALLGCDLSLMKGLREVAYQVERREENPTGELAIRGYVNLSIGKNRPSFVIAATSKETEFEVLRHQLVGFHFGVMKQFAVQQMYDKFYGPKVQEFQMIWILARITQSPVEPPKPLMQQPESRLLSLPDHIISKILSYLCLADQFTVFSPLKLSNSYFPTNRTQGRTAKKAECFPVFMACKRLSIVMREILYSKKDFVFQNAGLAMVDKLNPQDFDRIRKLRLMITKVDQDRPLRAMVLATRVNLRQLLRPTSQIQCLELAMAPLAVPFLTSFRSLLLSLREKCTVRISLIHNTVHDVMVGDKDITWMLDTDPSIIWTWDHKNYRWTNLEDLEGKRGNIMYGEESYLGKKLRKLLW